MAVSQKRFEEHDALILKSEMEASLLRASREENSSLRTVLPIHDLSKTG